MWASRILLVLCGLLIARPVLADISGTYVGSGTGLAVMMQIVETSGGNLIGRYDRVALQADGKIEETNATIAGAVNGETVVMTIKTPELFASAIPVSGTFRDDVLHLAGGSNLSLNLARGDDAMFRVHVASMIELSRQITDASTRQEDTEKKAKLEADRLSLLQNLTKLLVTFSTEADTLLPKFGAAEQLYRTITERMRAGLAEQRSVDGGGQASVARIQISVTLNEAAIDAHQTHLNDQQSYRDFDLNAGQLSHEVANANTWCEGTIPLSFTAVCPKFLEAQTSFAKRVSALRAAFAELETVWTTERREQEAITEASQQALN